jgi:Fe-S cluster biosynthesis and repair protein YggX
MARREKTIWIVDCVKLGGERIAMDNPPFPGELGQRIFNNVSKEAWGMWPQHATIVINHYGLNMADPRAQEMLMQEMEEFFFGEDAQMPEGWTPEGAQGPMAKGAAPRK